MRIVLTLVLFLLSSSTPQEPPEFILTWGSQGSDPGQFLAAQSMAVHSGSVYVVEGGNHRVQRFDTEGNLELTWGSRGSGDGEFDRVLGGGPRGLDVDENGNVYVTDPGNYRIQKFDANGAFIAKWGSEGTGNGQFTFPGRIGISSGGMVYVADEWAGHVQKFDSDGSFLLKWGSEGSGPGQFLGAGGVAVDGLGNVYVVDIGNWRVQ
jgi:tripartite motif-containing protein 71